MIRLSQIIALFILAPFFFHAFSYCPFRLPYLYCFICPVRCVWYRIRGLVLLIALGLNMRKSLFCTHLCPFGTVQDFLFKVSSKKVSLPSFFLGFKYISAILIVLIIIITKLPQALNYRFMTLTLNQAFITEGKNILFGVFILSMLVGIFSYRCFCNTLCPIRALSKILHKAFSFFGGR